VRRRRTAMQGIEADRDGGDCSQRRRDGNATVTPQIPLQEHGKIGQKEEERKSRMKVRDREKRGRRRKMEIAHPCTKTLWIEKVGGAES